MIYKNNLSNLNIFKLYINNIKFKTNKKNETK